MKKLFLTLLVIHTGIISLNKTVYAADNQRMFSGGIKGGVSIPTQDFDDGLEGSAGFTIALDTAFQVSDKVSLGAEFEYARMTADLVGSGELGHLNVIEFLPFLKINFSGQKYVPYALTGIGVNINHFSENDLVVFEIQAQSSFAFKFAAGVDIFVMDRGALMAEIGWKLNNTTLDFIGLGPINTNASSFFLLFGFRFSP